MGEYKLTTTFDADDDEEAKEIQADMLNECPGVIRDELVRPDGTKV